MSKKCIGCNRELPKQATICPACGAQQSILKHHKISIIVMLLALAGLSYAATRYVDSEAVKITEAVKSELDKELYDAQAQVLELKSELDSTKSQLSKVNETLDQLKAENSTSSSQADQIQSDLRKKLSAAEAESKKQQGRAGWLGRENARLKAELESLKKQVSTLQLPSSNNKDNLLGISSVEAGRSSNADLNSESKEVDVVDEGKKENDDQNSTENGIDPPTFF